MNPNTTAQRLLLLATAIHAMGAAMATVSSPSSAVEKGRSFLRSRESISSTNNNSDMIRRLFFQEKDNLFDKNELQNDSEDGIGASGITEPRLNTNIDTPQTAAAAPQTPASALEEINFDSRTETKEEKADASELEVETKVEAQVETENSPPVDPEPETFDENQNEIVEANSDASGSSTVVGTNDDNQAKDPELAEKTAEDEEKKIMNEYVFSACIVVIILLYLMYWRDNVIHQRIEFVQKQQEQRDRLKNLQLRTSLETEALSFDGSFTNAGVTLAEEIRFSPQNSSVPQNITTADKAINAIRNVGRGAGKTKTSDRDTSHTDKTAICEILDMHDDDDDDDDYELSSSRRPKIARGNLTSEEHWFKYNSSMRSNKGNTFKATSESE